MSLDSIKSQTENMFAHTVDQSQKENAEFMEKSGLEVRVTRVYDGVGLSGGRECKWCLSRCGENMTLSEAYAKGAFQRHTGCGCEILYTSSKGITTSQTRAGGTDSWQRRLDLESRKTIGLGKREVSSGERIITAAIQEQARANRSNILAETIIEQHEVLGKISPVEMKTIFENTGYDVLPLGGRSNKFAGVSYEDGGGYRILFGGDANFRYHPEGGIHVIAYWTISSGKTGKHQYGMDGEDVFFGRFNKRIIR